MSWYVATDDLVEAAADGAAESCLGASRPSIVPEFDTDLVACREGY